MDAHNPYDEILYAGRPFRKSHPDRLATIATLRGLAPPPVARSRVLELGCAVGGNLLPMAEQLPDARFVGIDGSLRQIEAARKTAAAAELTNVELLHGDLRTIAPELGEFDYIIAHGIYSWVPGDVQDKILDICGRQLAATGVAFISYNCYPGWHLRGTVHHLLRFATRDCDAPEERIRRAKRLSAALANSIADGHAEATAIKQELDLVATQDDSYVFHEYLADVNEPIYFHQFIERAGAKGLQYLDDTEFGLMSPDNLPQPVKEQVAAVASGPLEMEQFLDFVKNRKFRQTLLCRGEAALDRLAGPQRLESLYVASAARPEAAADLHDKAPTTYRTQAAAMVSYEPLVKAAMLELAENWPRALSFGALVTAARRRLAGPGTTIQAKAGEESSLLAGLLATGFGTSFIELSTQPSPFTLQLAERPLASPVARCQAASSETVTNRRHEPVQLSYVQRLMLRFIDGRHDRAGIVSGLLHLVEDGTLVIHDDDRPVQSGPRAKTLLTEAVNANLPVLARLALLVPSRT